MTPKIKCLTGNVNLGGGVQKIIFKGTLRGFYLQGFKKLKGQKTGKKSDLFRLLLCECYSFEKTSIYEKGCKFTKQEFHDLKFSQRSKLGGITQDQDRIIVYPQVFSTSQFK